MLEKVARTLRLSDDDNVVVATERTEPGATVAKGVTAHQRIPFGHKVAIQPIATGEPVSQVRPDHRLRQQAYRRGRLGARAQLRHGRRSTARSSATTRLPQGARAGEHSAGRGTGDVPGLSARQRQGRHAQLCRHPHLGELLDHRRRLHRQGDRALRHPRRLSQHRRHRRAEAGQWLRHRLSRRDLRHAEEDHLGLCHQPEHGRRGHGRARLRGLPDPALQGSLRRPGERDVPHHDDPGSRRHEEDRRGRRRGGEGHAADRQQRPSARRCRRRN